MTAITTAMVLAAGLGKRMRPLTDRIPKPMVEVNGRPLVDHVLDRLAAAGVTKAVVNLHWHADVLERHLAGRKNPRIVFSDERGELLETGGGIRKALPELGTEPFFVVNADTIWIEGIRPNLATLARKFDARRMDFLLLLAPAATSIGYEGRGDFLMDGESRLTPRPEREMAPFVYAGAAVVAPDVFAQTPEGSFSLSRLFVRAAEAGRLFGERMEGVWMHVGTPEAIDEAEDAIARSKD
ncbi:nucleotidyltransferase family protein [Starkeya koreensis]|uniref:Nucleotidyltransferase family protein n=1 Tax=Ancylobacter koreensis TaxID=266121 RepID=A0ABT0DJP3_9HYPH|nr:nucleotidyltransferase family protein [Ancylobacter koreensis]MCK0207496.1 nucleotidyltransferase family protein [Ancylobacter koreensis]